MLLLLNYDINLPTREYFTLRLLALCNATTKEIFLTNYLLELSLTVSLKYFIITFFSFLNILSKYSSYDDILFKIYLHLFYIKYIFIICIFVISCLDKL